jgi:molybdate transport repressor ModE-like protein
MTVGGVNLGGPGRIALLAKIAECGSITQAAKAIRMSYKAAWDAIDAMNNLAGEPLVERLAGGKGGGGTRLTARGEQLVANFSADRTRAPEFRQTPGRTRGRHRRRLLIGQEDEHENQRTQPVFGNGHAGQARRRQRRDRRWRWPAGMPSSPS